MYPSSNSPRENEPPQITRNNCIFVVAFLRGKMVEKTYHSKSVLRYEFFSDVSTLFHSLNYLIFCCQMWCCSLSAFVFLFPSPLTPTLLLSWQGCQVTKVRLVQGCTTQISSGPKKILGAYPRARIDIFVTSLRELFQANRLNTWHFGLYGPNKKLPRATFGPRAVFCARLV